MPFTEQTVRRKHETLGERVDPSGGIEQNGNRIRRADLQIWVSPLRRRLRLQLASSVSYPFAARRTHPPRPLRNAPPPTRSSPCCAIPRRRFRKSAPVSTKTARNSGFSLHLKSSFRKTASPARNVPSDRNAVLRRNCTRAQKTPSIHHNTFRKECGRMFLRDEPYRERSSPRPFAHYVGLP